MDKLIVVDGTHKTEVMIRFQFISGVRGGLRRNTTFGNAKLEWCGYPMVKQVLMISLTVFTQYRRVTDTQSDRQTDEQTDILREHAWSAQCIALRRKIGYFQQINRYISETIEDTHIITMEDQ